MNDDSELVDSLLGPSGPEVTCEECFEQLDRYTETELSGGSADAAVPGMGEASSPLRGALSHGNCTPRRPKSRALLRAPSRLRTR